MTHEKILPHGWMAFQGYSNGILAENVNTQRKPIHKPYIVLSESFE